MVQQGMAMLLKLLIEDMHTTALAVITGLLLFRKLNVFLKVLLLQTSIYLLVDTIALNEAFTAESNTFIYNLYVPVEFFLLLLAIHYTPTLRIPRWTSYLIYVTYLLIYVPELLLVNWNTKLVVFSTLTAYLLASCVFIYVIYSTVNSDESFWFKISSVAVSLGIVIYCAGSIPCLAALFDVFKVSKETAQEVYQNTVLLLADIRYLFLAIGCGFLAYSKMYKKTADA